MPRTRAPMYWSRTDLIMSTYDKVTLFLTPIGMLLLLFRAQFALFFAVVATQILILFAFRCFTNWEHYIHQPCRLEQYRKYILAGSAITTVLSVLPRIVVLLGPEYSYLVWYIYLTVGPTIFLTWMVFVNHYKDRCEVFISANDNFYQYVIYVNLLLFMFTVFFSLTFSDGFLKIFCCQLWFSGIGAASMVEFCQVARWKIKLAPFDPIRFQEEFNRYLVRDTRTFQEFLEGKPIVNPDSIQ